MERPNYRKGSIIFDDDTILQVEQRGGGGSGVGGETGLAAVNLKTGESTNAALAAKDETIAEQAATIETQAATIIELQEELADVPTIEALNVTANGTYSEEGKAYSPVNVNVPEGMYESPAIGLAFTNNTAATITIGVPKISYGNYPSDSATVEVDNITIAPGERKTKRNIYICGGRNNRGVLSYRVDGTLITSWTITPPTGVEILSGNAIRVNFGSYVPNNWIEFSIN